MDERRRSPRLRAWFLMQVQSAERGRWLAMTRNMSESGALLATASRLAVGEPVTLIFKLGAEDESERELAGTIVRVERNVEDPGGFWPHRVAVEFEQPVPELARAIETDSTSWSADYILELEREDGQDEG